MNMERTLINVSMTHHNQTLLRCSAGEAPLSIAIILLLLFLPLHLLVAKILCIDAQLALPHHKIMLSVTTSDSMQLFIVAIYIIVDNVLSSISNEAILCSMVHISNTVMLFFGVITLTASSLGIVTMSIERYISCIYSFYIHQIMTTKRVIMAVCTQWTIAVSCAVLAVAIQDKSNSTIPPVTNSPISKYLTVVTVIPSAIVIIVLQLRLFFFSRSKIVRVDVVGAFGNRAGLADSRKRQLKATFATSIVAIAYVACMLPVAILFAFEIQHGEHLSKSAQFIKRLALLNNLADPIVYGIGIADTRKQIWKNIKAAKNYLFRQQ